MIKKATRPFTIILDDLVRSPLINAGEFRLYSFLLSYCPKSASAEKTCSLTKAVIAGELRISTSGVTKQLRKLEDLGLITIGYITQQKPTYTMNTAPPESVCPEAFKGRKWKAALTYIKANGGVKKLQTKTNKSSLKKENRVGWPPHKSDGLEDGDQPQTHPQVSLISSTPTLQSMGISPEAEFDPHTPVWDPPHSSPSVRFKPPHSSPSRYIVKKRVQKEYLTVCRAATGVVLSHARRAPLSALARS